MKKYLLIIAVIVFLQTCAGSPVRQNPQNQGGNNIESLIKAVRSGNAENIIAHISPDIEASFHISEEPVESNNGRQFVKAFNQKAASVKDFKNLIKQKPEVIGDNNRKEIFFPAIGESNWELFIVIEQRKNRWLITRWNLYAAGMHPLLAWADKNGNRQIDEKEIPGFLTGIVNFLAEPREGLRGPGEFFDLNGDKNIDHIELEIARHKIIWSISVHTNEADPDLGRLLDFNNDRVIQLPEQLVLQDYLFHIPEVREPHAVQHPLDEAADMNNDNFVDTREYEQFISRILLILPRIPIIIDSEPDIYTSSHEIRMWADVNFDDAISEKELISVIFALQEIISFPNQVAANPIAKYFDINRDREIDFKESDRARKQILGQIKFLKKENLDDFTREFLDVDNNNTLNQNDAEILSDFFKNREAIIANQEKNHPVFRKIDINSNGVIEEEEVEQFNTGLFMILAGSWLTNRLTELPVIDVQTALDEFSDTNKDGKVDQREYQQKMFGLHMPHRVRTPFDRGIDFNGNDFVDWFEIEKAKRAGAVFREIEEMDENASYRVLTRADKLLDLNNDNLVSEEEINSILTAVTSQPEVLKDRPLFNFLDRDKNKKLTQDEIITSIQLFLQPHPVNKRAEMDKNLDTNKDGFVSPEEIGIAAGIVEGGFVPNLLERIEQFEFISYSKEREVSEAAEVIPETATSSSGSTAEGSFDTVESSTETADSDSGTEADTDSTDTGSQRTVTVYQQKLQQMENKKLAVVDLSSLTDSVDAETSSGLIVFVENAFVNVGKTTVVDRANIEKVIEEQKMQLSGLIDESTAVEIGKLSGAEIIVTGSISKVGNIYYLNIKLTDVESAQIIGSSIAEAETASEFLEMCNTAVYELF